MEAKEADEKTGGTRKRRTTRRKRRRKTRCEDNWGNIMPTMMRIACQPHEHHLELVSKWHRRNRRMQTPLSILMRLQRRKLNDRILRVPSLSRSMCRSPLVGLASPVYLLLCLSVMIVPAR